MSKLIIHIGLHKTATTHIQYSFLPNLQGVVNAHGNKFFRNWSRQLDDNTTHMVMSYEGFSGVPWNDKWKTGITNDHSWLGSFSLNIQKLSQIFPNAAVFVFFRKHGDLLVSLYKQYIQEGGVLPIAEFYGNGKVIAPDDLSIKRRIELIKQSFRQVYLLNFEAYKLQGDNYLKEFFYNEFSIQTGAISVKSKKNNRSVSGWKLDWLRKVNIYYNRWPQRLKKVIRYIRWSPRDIVQTRLSFLKSEDSIEIKRLKQSINRKFTSDWDYFLQQQWKSKS